MLGTVSGNQQGHPFPWGGRGLGGSGESPGLPQVSLNRSGEPTSGPPASTSHLGKSPAPPEGRTPPPQPALPTRDLHSPCWNVSSQTQRRTGAGISSVLLTAASLALSTR